MKFIVYRDDKKEFRFRIVGKNNKIMATGESYKRRQGVYKAINAIIEAIQITGFEIVEQGE
jgi:uncharacterized protein YegP (UPF0339 family)